MGSLYLLSDRTCHCFAFKLFQLTLFRSRLLSSPIPDLKLKVELSCQSGQRSSPWIHKHHSSNYSNRRSCLLFQHVLELLRYRLGGHRCHLRLSFISSQLCLLSFGWKLASNGQTGRPGCIASRENWRNGPSGLKRISSKQSFCHTPSSTGRHGSLRRVSFQLQSAPN